MFWYLPNTNESLGSLPCTDQKSRGTWNVAGQPCLTAVQKEFKIRKRCPSSLRAGRTPQGWKLSAWAGICQPSYAVVASRGGLRLSSAWAA